MKRNSGQMLIEALVALSVFLIALTAITIAVVLAVTNSRFTEDQNGANKWAQDGIEKIRSLGYNEVQTFDLTGDVYTMDSSGTLNNTGNENNVNIENKYIRTATFHRGAGSQPCNSAQSIKVTVMVRWNSGKCPSSDRFCHSSTQSTCITESGI